MNRCNRLIVDCTDLVHYGGNTGIQRTERNLINHLQQLSKDYQIPLKLAAFHSAYGFVEIPSLQNSQEAIGYVRSVAAAAREPWRAKRLLKTIFLDQGNAGFLDGLWSTWWRFPIATLLVATLSPLIIFAVIAATHLKNRLTIASNDVFVILGSSWWADGYETVVSKLRSNGVAIVVLIYDTIPITHPTLCDTLVVQKYSNRFPSLLRDAALIFTISQDTANSILKNGSDSLPCGTSVIPIQLGFELDLREASSSVRPAVLSFFGGGTPVFISVGTLEPRKNYDFLMDVFETAWKDAPSIRLAIIGKYGWRAEATRTRLIDRQKENPNFFWFDDLNDTELEFAYRNASALVFPSMAEGFGLPIVEALSYHCPVLASDIAVFREIGAEYCAYFSIEDPSGLVELVQQTAKYGSVPGIANPSCFTWPTWRQSAGQLMEILKTRFTIVGDADFISEPKQDCYETRD